MLIELDMQAGSCAGTIAPDHWTEQSTHRLASKACFGCSEQVDCYLTALVERHCGTWGGVWFPALTLTGPKATTLYLRDGTGNTALRRVLPLVIEELSRRMRITTEQFRSRYGYGELAVYCAVTGKRPEEITVAKSG